MKNSINPSECDLGLVRRSVGADNHCVVSLVRFQRDLAMKCVYSTEIKSH